MKEVVGTVTRRSRRYQWAFLDPENHVILLEETRVLDKSSSELPNCSRRRLNVSVKVKLKSTSCAKGK